MNCIVVLPSVQLGEPSSSLNASFFNLWSRGSQISCAVLNTEQERNDHVQVRFLSFVQRQQEYASAQWG